MATALVELGFQRPKQKIRMSFKETCITVAWATLAVLVGMGIVSSISAVNPLVAQSSTSVGL